MSDIEIRLFRYFVALAEERHFSHAALRLKITPPTLTHQIKKLETELGAKLVVRKGNTLVTLTEAGQRFLASAQRVLDQAEEAAAIARQAERGQAGRIALGFNASVSCGGLLQAWIGEFQRANPAIDITMRQRCRWRKLRRSCARSWTPASPALPTNIHPAFKVLRFIASP